MTTLSNVFILVRDSKPTAYNDIEQAIKMYLHSIDQSPNAYEYEGCADLSRLESEINETGKLSFYGFTNDSAPTAIALYKSTEPYNAADWYNMAAKENAKNLEVIRSIEDKLNTINTLNKRNKLMAVGDFIELADGRCGRIDVLNNHTMQVDFDGADKAYPVSSFGCVGKACGTLGWSYKRPVRFRLTSLDQKLGSYWMRGAASEGQGNKRLDIFLKTNVWSIETLEAA